MRQIFDFKIILTVLIFFLVAMVLFFAFYNGKSGENIYETILNEKEAVFIIDYGQNGKERWFKGDVSDGMTIKNVLEAASVGGKFNFAVNSHLSMLDGFYNNSQRRWRCYLNDKEVQEGLDKTIISPKDKVMCIYK